ncbi:S1 family peptidase [Streptomyces pratensis]|uniref:S1 family peptidase n=1 Tax=Streptomyces pratensis TaxID=1169025 RepID=UPI003016FF97
MRRNSRARLSVSLLLVAGALGLDAAPSAAAGAPSADAAPAIPAPSAYALDAAVERDLGAETAGSYLDRGTGDLVVTVTTDRAEERARAAGATVRRVERSAAQLRSAMDTLEAEAKIAGTSWGVDPRANRVTVEADSSVSTQDMARLEAVAERLGPAVSISRVPGVFHREVLGGGAIYGGGSRCSAAFNVTKGGARYFVTAGHCTDISANWAATSGGPVIGAREDSSFPTNDYGIVRYTDGSSPAGAVDLHNGSSQDIASAANAVVGQAISKSGSTTKVTRGTVTAVNVTVNYSDGPVYGMVRTTACSAGGDSGGAHFAGSVALGIHSGSSGCSGASGSAIHQPVREALAAYGVSVY